MKNIVRTEVYHDLVKIFFEDGSVECRYTGENDFFVSASNGRISVSSK